MGFPDFESIWLIKTPVNQRSNNRGSTVLVLLLLTFIPLFSTVCLHLCKKICIASFAFTTLTHSFYHN